MLEYVSPSRLSSSYMDGRMLNRYENELGDFGRSRIVAFEAGAE